MRRSAALLSGFAMLNKNIPIGTAYGKGRLCRHGESENNNKEDAIRLRK